MFTVRRSRIVRVESKPKIGVPECTNTISIDQTIVDERVAQYSRSGSPPAVGRIERRGVSARCACRTVCYMQRHAYMHRIAIPYGNLRSDQLRMLATIAREHDRGYGHFSTRSNIQFNWVELEETPEILRKLASVQMHAIQTSGNCIRNITADQFAGVAPDELVDPRPWAEILRQWSTFHPEFAWLPRKFKIAVSGSVEDRAAVQMHDLGVYLKKQRGRRSGREHSGGRRVSDARRSSAR